MALQTAPVDAVYCIACGTVYSKPADGGRSGVGQQCPACSHVGWIAVGFADRTPPAPETPS
jgi:hypothetical protein